MSGKPRTETDACASFQVNCVAALDLDRQRVAELEDQLLCGSPHLKWISTAMLARAVLN
jgi:hypothetical protein